MQRDRHPAHQQKGSKPHSQNGQRVPTLLLFGGMHITGAHGHDQHWCGERDDERKHLPDWIAERVQEDVHRYLLLPSSVCVRAPSFGACVTSPARTGSCVGAHCSTSRWTCRNTIQREQTYAVLSMPARMKRSPRT